MTSVTPNSFDYLAFVDEGYASQQKYANASGRKGPFDEMTPDQRYGKIIEFMGHLTEELMEARVYVPRRSWKNNEPSYLNDPELRSEFVAELFDILLFHRSILAYAGITGEEFTRVASAKMGYNAVRKDHITNGTESAVQNPAAELHGECPSSKFDSSV